MKIKPLSVLRSAIPSSRGIAEHIETGNSLHAAVEYSTKTKTKTENIIRRIYTPDEPLKRVHELLHANFSNPREKWPDVSEPVRQIIEDCKMHLKHWPWELNNEPTPKLLKDSIEATVKQETEMLIAELEMRGGKETANTRAERLLMIARFISLPHGFNAFRHHTACSSTQEIRDKIVSNAELKILSKIVSKCATTRWRDAARMLEELISLTRPNSDTGEGDETEGEHKESKKPLKGSCGETMHIQELPLCMATAPQTTEEEVLAPSGRTINYRELLRGKKMVRPNSVFKRELEEEKRGGTILIDASGSMDVNSRILAEFCKSLPAAKVAYYVGHRSSEGTLSIYAKNGKRADSTPIKGCDNEIDNSALTWLLKQEEPRYFITDERFCGGNYAMAEVRFEAAVNTGEITGISNLATASEIFSRLT